VPLGSDLRNLSTAASCHIGRRNLKSLRVKVLVIHHERNREKRTTSLNPPPEKSAATSGTWVVPPTAVTLHTFVFRNECQLRTHLRAIQRTTGITDLQWATRRKVGHKPSTVLAVIRDARLHRRVGATISDTAVPRTE
jgi:hypothetical protein